MFFVSFIQIANMNVQACEVSASKGFQSGWNKIVNHLRQYKWLEIKWSVSCVCLKMAFKEIVFAT